MPEFARLAPLTLLAGLASGVGTVAVHQRWWGLTLGVATTALVLVAAPAGPWTRLPFAAGFAGVVALGMVPRPEGDYLVAATSEGYTLLGTALVVLGYAVATLRRPGESPTDEGRRFLP